MKTNEAPEKIYLDEDESWHLTNPNGDSVEYIRTDVFIEKARKWFEKRYEWIDIDGTRNYDKSAFEDFKNYTNGE